MANEWEARWREGRTGWDHGRSPPVLQELIASGTLPNGRALVPGAGAGYDVLTLASPERTVIGLDIAPTAKARFEALRSELGLPAEQARIELADFFTLDPAALGGRFDLIWDYTFLCAIPPERRSDWVRKMSELLAPGGELITLIFPVVEPRPTQDAPGEGPPFPMHPELVRELVAGTFEPTVLEPVTHSHASRVGREWLGRWRRSSD